MRLTVHLAVLAALVPGAGGCVGNGGDAERSGYVTAGLDGAEVVRVAWPYARLEDYSARAKVRGEEAVVEGAFDLDALLAAQEGFDPPPRGCAPGQIMSGDGVRGLPQVSFSFGGLVATRAGAMDDVGADELGAAVVAAAPDLGVAWADADIARDSPEGQRLESALHAGFQLVRLRPCRVPVECQGVEELPDLGNAKPDLCLEPWPADAMVVLQP